MDKWDEALEEIFKAPEFAHIKAPVKRVTKNDRLLNSFDEIVSFVEKEKTPCVVNRKENQLL